MELTLQTNGEDATQVRTNFTAALNAAILGGRMQTSLDAVAPTSDVYLLTGRVIPPTSAPVAVSTTLGTEYIVLIAAGGVVFLLAVGWLIRTGRQPPPQRKSELLPIVAGPDDIGSPVSRDVHLGPGPGPSGQLGVTPADYGKQGKSSAKVVETLEEIDQTSPNVSNAEEDKVNESADSSNAGDSGWSSSLGQSSAHTGSLDSLDYGSGQAAGASLAAIGAASAIAGDREEGYVFKMIACVGIDACYFAYVSDEVGQEQMTGN